MLCAACGSIDFAKFRPPGFVVQDHHASYADICQAASGGCELCQLIVEANDKRSQEHYNNRKPPDWVKIEELRSSNQIECYMYSANGLPKSIYGPYSEIVFTHRNSGEDSWKKFFYINLRCYTKYDAPRATTELCSGRPIENMANSDFCFSLAQKWLNICLETHGESCLRTQKARMPTRVIDVGLPDGSQPPRLLVTDSQHGSWFSLSHCWGKLSRFTTTSENLQERQNGIEIEDMPPTFQDAVEVTRRLGQRFIWIDSLCIIQDSHADWVKESKVMGQYYKFASLTIATDSANGDYDGFLRTPRHAIKEASMPLEIRLGGDDSSVLYIEKDCANLSLTNGSTYLNRRAWTLQEDLLSPRSLHYTQDQLIWECQSQKYCESDCNPVGNSNDLKKDFLTAPQSTSGIADSVNSTMRWYQIVTDYTTRSLTIPDDRLPAISGIAREVHRQNGLTYKAGIWLEDFYRSLAWEMDGNGYQPQNYRAPSWSWASLDYLQLPKKISLRGLYSTVTFTEEYRSKYDISRTEVLGCDLVLSDEDEFGCIKSGYIRLRGKTLSIARWKGTKSPYIRAYWPKSQQQSHFLASLQPNEVETDLLWLSFDHFPPGSDETSIDFEAISLFQLSTWDWKGPSESYAEREPVVVALMLEVADELGNFRRVGLAHVPSCNGLAEDGWEVKDVTII